MRINSKMVKGLIITLTISIGVYTIHTVQAQIKEEKIQEEFKQQEEAKKLEELKIEEAKRLAEEEAKRLAEEEAKRLAEEEAERLRQEEEAKRLAEEEAERLRQEEAKRLAEEEAKRLAEEEAKEENLNIPPSNSVETTKPIAPTTPTSYTNQQVGAIYIEGTVSKNLIDFAQSYLNKVPSNITNQFISDGWQLRITTKDISTHYYKDTSLGSIAGLAMYNDKMLVLEDRESAITGALIHEFGHYYDYKLGFISESEEFIDIYNAEKNTFVVESHDGHYKRNTREFFAETFEQYFYNPERCKRTAPRAYEFHKNNMGKV